MKNYKKIAIVYDWVDKWGGVERILLYLNQLFPDADFFTSYVDLKKAPWAKDLNIKTSFIQTLPNFIKNSRLLSLPFYPYAFQSFDFSSYDLVISITSSFAKSIITKPETFHLCYLLTPTRFLWDFSDIYLKKYKFLSGYIKRLKKWDYQAAQRPDKIISISKTVADRCLKYYKRQSKVIYPPFHKQYWCGIKSKIQQQKIQIKSELIGLNNYYLTVSRLEPYKKIDLAVKTFNQLNQPLIVVGTGSQENKLKQIAKSNITFLKEISDAELAWLYSHAKALIMPQEEDFGYVAVEAGFFNLPIVAFKKGGATEIVIDGKTGIFFDEQTEESLIRALETFQGKSYNFKQEITDRFGKDNFGVEFMNSLESEL